MKVDKTRPCHSWEQLNNDRNDNYNTISNGLAGEQGPPWLLRMLMAGLLQRRCSNSRADYHDRRTPPDDFPGSVRCRCWWWGRRARTSSCASSCLPSCPAASAAPPTTNLLFFRRPTSLLLHFSVAVERRWQCSRGVASCNHIQTDSLVQTSQVGTWQGVSPFK